MAKKKVATKKASRTGSVRRTPALDLNSRKAKEVRGSANLASLPEPIKKSSPKRKASKKKVVKKAASRRTATKSKKKAVRPKAATQSAVTAPPESAVARTKVAPAKLAKALGRRRRSGGFGGAITPGGIAGQIGQ